MPKAAGLTPSLTAAHGVQEVWMPKAAGLTPPLTAAHGVQEVWVCLKQLV